MKTLDQIFDNHWNHFPFDVYRDGERIREDVKVVARGEQYEVPGDISTGYPAVLLQLSDGSQDVLPEEGLEFDNLNGDQML